MIVARLAWALVAAPFAAGRSGLCRRQPRHERRRRRSGRRRLLQRPRQRQHGSTRRQPIEIKPDDYDAFERTLDDVQAAYSNEDVTTLGDW